MAKTDRNSIFLGRDTNISDRLYTIVLYKNFTGFKKILILAQNPKVLAFSFTEKCHFVTKIELNYVFLGRETHILELLFIMVLYIIFMGFRKNQISTQNPKVLDFGFTENASLWHKLTETQYFLAVKLKFCICYS
jgi:hypothetical protein